MQNIHITLDMSFFVSFNGQFKPYTPSNFRQFYKVDKSSKTDHIIELRPHEQTDISKSKQKIEHYEKHQKNEKGSNTSVFAKYLMHSPVFYHYESDSYKTIFNSFQKYHYKHFPILNELDQLVGIVSDRDLLHCEYKDHLVKDFMTKEVLTVRSNARIQEISKVMLSEGLSALPVVDDQNSVIGIITKSDILEFIVKNFHLKVFI